MYLNKMITEASIKFNYIKKIKIFILRLIGAFKSFVLFKNI